MTRPSVLCVGDETQRGAYQWWLDAGEPSVDAWQFTITPAGQRIELVRERNDGTESIGRRLLSH